MLKFDLLLPGSFRILHMQILCPKQAWRSRGLPHFRRRGHTLPSLVTPQAEYCTVVCVFPTLLDTHDILHHRRLLLLPFLGLASLVVQHAAAARQSLYESGVLTWTRLPVPVISVGNLTWGGNGIVTRIPAVYNR
jgi:hypothetical protein